MTHTEKSHHWTPSIIIMAAGAALTVAAFSMGLGRTEIAAVILFSGLLLILVHPRLAIMCCFTYLALVGDLRRMMSGAPGNVDPMLLIGPIWTAALLIRAFVTGLVRFDTPLAKMATVLVALMAIQIFNPKQGGFAAGFAGAVIYIVPMCWYFIGRAFGDGKFTRMVLWRVLIPVAVAGALLGLYQTFYGFLSFERHWIVTSGYTALMVGRVRPFGFFVSAAEYALFLSMGCVLLVATLVARRPRWGYLLLLLPLLLIALFLESSRTPIALLIAASCAMWGATAATNTGAVVRMGLALAMMGGILTLGLTRLADMDLPENVQPLVAHQTEGLLDPSHSSAAGHATLFKQGIVDGLKNPLGEGIGSTIAAAKYGGESKSSEVDISDMFVCLGLGGILYTALVVVGLVRAVRHFREFPTVTALATVGILLASLGTWIFGSMYAAAPVLCFLLGTTDPSPEPVAQEAQPFQPRFRAPIPPDEPVPQPGRGAVPNFRRPQTFP